MMFKLISVLSVLIALTSTPTWGQDVSKRHPVAGEQTQDWLKLQREGSQASPLLQPISGPVASRIYQRYQDSFSHPIPEYFTGDDADASVTDD